MAEAEEVDEDVDHKRACAAAFKLRWVAVSHDDPSTGPTSSMAECQFLRYLEAVATRMVDRIKLPTRRTRIASDEKNAVIRGSFEEAESCASALR